MWGDLRDVTQIFNNTRHIVVLRGSDIYKVNVLDESFRCAAVRRVIVIPCCMLVHEDDHVVVVAAARMAQRRLRRSCVASWLNPSTPTSPLRWAR